MLPGIRLRAAVLMWCGCC